MILRGLREKDIDYILEWMHDDDISGNYKNDFKNFTKESVKRFVESSFSDRNQHFAFVDDKDTYMGTISLKNISKGDSNAEYAIVTRKCAQGTGIATKATEEILKYAFEELKLHKVYLNVLSDNKKANKFYEKCKFQYEGTAKQHILVDGTYRDINWYGMVSGDYKFENKE